MRKFSGDRLLVATHNKGKLEEIADLLAPFGVSVVGAAELNLPEPDETETTFVGNARIKAHAAAQATGLPALAEAQDTAATLRDLARRATIYLFPVYEMYRARRLHGRLGGNPERARFRHGHDPRP